MRYHLYLIFCFFISGALSSPGFAQSPVSHAALSEIRLNQLGFYPHGPKIAVILAEGAATYQIVSVPGGKAVFKGKLAPSVNPALNGKTTLIADFSSLQDSGRYTLVTDGGLTSYPFKISADTYHALAKASVKAYYYQRASMDLAEQYAGKWHRTAGHPDTKVLIHTSAATEKRPAGMVISTPGGWYDAGDYNKYVVNSGVTMGTLLSLCEDFPDYIKKINLNIPESGNDTPDILDEILYNLRWMKTMQDPDDGGVYNKVTNAAFDGFVMPNLTKAPRYVVQKGTAATLDFAAVMAQAGRVLKNYPKDFPGLADSCITASVKAWNWAQKNPNMAYDQNDINQKFTPKITTGGYGDRSFNDELIWATCELYLTTRNGTYFHSVNLLSDRSMPLPSWGQVKLLGYYSMIRKRKTLTGEVANMTDTIKKQLLKLCDGLIIGVNDRAYRTVMGKSGRDFGWGSNAQAGNQGVALINAYLMTGNKEYIDMALGNLDYLLGRNGTGYSYVTGYGSKTPMHPHHRISAADGVADPVPGLLVGGSNPGRQDGIALPSIVPDEAYIDDERAYATNEIAINWNAPLAYLINAIEALRTKAGYTDK